MCGIVGLFLKDKALEPKLGSLLSGMLGPMCDRGPDSAGFAVYGDSDSGKAKITLQSPQVSAFEGLDRSLGRELGAPVAMTVRETHAVLVVDADAIERARAILRANYPDLRVMGAGERIEIYKEVGHPIEVAARFGLAGMSGTHGIGHTRMATESAVTTLGAHPFSTGADQCLVHNGSLSNHNNLRRSLARDGMEFETQNDSEVAAAYLTTAMARGRDLGAAL